MKTISHKEKDFDTRIKSISTRKAFTKKIEKEEYLIERLAGRDSIPTATARRYSLTTT